MGKLYEITGLDAAGKGVQCQLLKEYFARKGQVQLLKYPNPNSKIGELIYKALQEGNFNNYMMQGFQTLCRLEDQTKIIFLLRNGYNVVCDRYIVDSLVYGSCDQVDYNWIFDINSHLVQPDISIYIDITVDESFKRRAGRRDFYESDYDFMTKIRHTYLQEFKKMPQGYIVDGMQPVIDVYRDIIRLIEC